MSPCCNLQARLCLPLPRTRLNTMRWTRCGWMSRASLSRTTSAPQHSVHWQHCHVAASAGAPYRCSSCAVAENSTGCALSSRADTQVFDCVQIHPSSCFSSVWLHSSTGDHVYSYVVSTGCVTPPAHHATTSSARSHLDDLTAVLLTPGSCPPRLCQLGQFVLYTRICIYVFNHNCLLG
jgi:hypothetical protein